MLARKRIGEILVELGVISPAEVDDVLLALRRRGDFAKFGQVAKDMRLAHEEHILAALAVQLELVPRGGELSLESLLDQLRAPVQTPPPLAVKTLRRKLTAK